MSGTHGNSYSDFTVSGNANVHAGNNYIASPMPEKPTPRSLVPQFFERDQNFIGREDIIKEIGKRLAIDDEHNRVALTGLGGIGKSQIALEFASRYSKEHRDRWVFWVSASSKTRFIQDLRELTASANISVSNGIEALASVRRWLSDSGNGKWLMIIDNADNADVLFDLDSQSNRSLSSLIPWASHGSVIVTSCNTVGTELAGGSERAIYVPEFSMKEACHLIRRRIPSPDATDEEINILADKLNGIPLAISQACAYIAKTRMRLREYVAAFEQNESNQVRLLGQE